MKQTDYDALGAALFDARDLRGKALPAGTTLEVRDHIPHATEIVALVDGRARWSYVVSHLVPIRHSVHESFEISQEEFDARMVRYATSLAFCLMDEAPRPPSRPVKRPFVALPRG